MTVAPNGLAAQTWWVFTCGNEPQPGRDHGDQESTYPRAAKASSGRRLGRVRKAGRGEKAPERSRRRDVQEEVASCGAGPSGRREPARPRGPQHERGPAPPRPTCHQAQQLARRCSRSGLTGSGAVGLQAARLRAWRVAGVTIWHERSAKRNAVERSARASDQFVKRARRSRTRDGHQGPRSPATGRAAFVTLPVQPA